MNKIAELLRQKRADIETRKALRMPNVPQDDRRVLWNRNRFRIFAEIKRSSLSAGSIRTIPDLRSLAVDYHKAGADAISVLTEEHYFHGSLDDLKSVRSAVPLPLLQKDFVIDPYQILEAKEAGADFVLLIARFLTSAEIQEFLELCDRIQVNAIVEVTDEADLAKIQIPVRFLGVNSRDLETLEVKTERFQQLREKLPDAFLIAESGINRLETLKNVMELGYHGALIGAHFLRAEDPAGELKKFVQCSVGRASLPAASATEGGVLIKICGITNERDAMMALDAGASALGFIFAESPRRIISKALNIFRHRISVPCVGVFRGNSSHQIAAIVKQCELDIAQIYDHESVDNIPVWRAHTITKLEEAGDVKLSENQLLDIKLPENEMDEAWRSLRDKNIFALAGGLDPQNVARAIALCRPAWVDVARGVENEPGVKDPQKVQEFIKAVKENEFAG